MPCTVEPWEVAAMESDNNERDFKKRMLDVDVATEAACQACRALDAAGLMKGRSRFLRKWWKLHQEKDKEAGR